MSLCLWLSLAKKVGILRPCQNVETVNKICGQNFYRRIEKKHGAVTWTERNETDQTELEINHTGAIKNSIHWAQFRGFRSVLGLKLAQSTTRTFQIAVECVQLIFELPPSHAVPHSNSHKNCLAKFEEWKPKFVRVSIGITQWCAGFKSRRRQKISYHVVLYSATLLLY
jgi:hypothetical protein